MVVVVAEVVVVQTIKTRSVIIYCLVSLVVKASASRAEEPGFKSRLRRDFSRSSHTSDL